MTALPLATPPPRSGQVANEIFPRIVLAIDFGSASLGAARWATANVAHDCDAVLVHVVPSRGSELYGHAPANSGGEPLDRLIPALVGGLGGFGATLDLASMRNIVRAGRPSACVAAVANGTEAALLVLGRRGDANRIRVGEPNVIERVTRRTSASVLVVPEGTMRAPDHIFAAVDKSRFARHVLDVAGGLARVHELPLTLVHVLPPAAGPYERVFRSAEHRRARDVIDCVSTEVPVGDPAREIVRTALKCESPLVVVGLRGADDAPLGSLGSVARELLTRAPMPVLAVNAI
jgi:nucleotide-binding universal stress UspA family protein